MHWATSITPSPRKARPLEVPPPVLRKLASERARRLRRALVQYVKPTLNERFGSIGCTSPRR